MRGYYDSNLSCQLGQFVHLEGDYEKVVDRGWGGGIILASYMFHCIRVHDNLM